MTIYERIKARREQLGLSQGELARRLGYTDRSTIAKIERGVNDIAQAKVPSFADALQTTVPYLMGWSDRPEPEPLPGDDGLREYLEELKSRPELRMLFSASRAATKQDVMRAVAIIEALKKETEESQA